MLFISRFRSNCVVFCFSPLFVFLIAKFFIAWLPRWGNVSIQLYTIFDIIIEIYFSILNVGPHMKTEHVRFDSLPIDPFTTKIF